MEDIELNINNINDIKNEIKKINCKLENLSEKKNFSKIKLQSIYEERKIDHSKNLDELCNFCYKVNEYHNLYGNFNDINSIKKYIKKIEVYNFCKLYCKIYNYCMREEFPLHETYRKRDINSYYKWVIENVFTKIIEKQFLCCVE